MDTIRDPLPLRIIRILAGVELMLAPVLFGFAHTFAQKQDAVAGFLLVALGIVGLLVDGVRPLIAAIGVWLLLSPAHSGFYFGAPLGADHDRVMGVFVVLVSILPLPLGGGFRIRRRISA